MVQKTLSKAVIRKLMKKYRRPLGTKVGDSQQIMKKLLKGASMPTFMAKKGVMSDEKRKKSNKSLEILDDVFAFSSHYRDTPLELGASLMVAAKSIYLETLGPKQTQDMLYTFASNLDHIEFEKITIH